MEDLAAALRHAVDRYGTLGWPRPVAAVVSGSGLGVEIVPAAHGPAPLSTLLPFPIHPVDGHAHEVELLLPAAGGAARPILHFRGRLHLYQGYDAHQTVFPVRLAALLGARVLILTNAAGGVDPARRAGDLVLVRDQLNLTGTSPLRGQLPPAWGARFPDMTSAFDRRLAALARAAAAELGVEIAEGVYAGLSGPAYETPAEVRMLRTLGADLAGMSTVLEVLAARHMGLACLGISLVTNAAAGLGAGPLDHAEVLAAGTAAADRLRALLAALLSDPALLGPA